MTHRVAAVLTVTIGVGVITASVLLDVHGDILALIILLLAALMFLTILPRSGSHDDHDDPPAGK